MRAKARRWEPIMKRKVISILLAVAMAVSLLAGCGSKTSKESTTDSASNAQKEGSSDTTGDTGVKDASAVLKDGKNTSLTIVFPGASSAPADKEAIEAKFNEIVQQKIDCTVDFNILEWGVFQEQENLMLSSGEPVDIVLLAGNVQNCVNSGQILDITDLVDTYANDTKESMGQYLKACYIGKSLYGFPTYHEYATASGLVCATKILDEMGVDPSTIKTWDDVSNLLAQVHKNYPDLDVLVPPEMTTGMMLHYWDGTFDKVLTNMVGVYADGRDGLTAHNIYGTDEFMNLAKVAYDWNQKGYFIADPTTITETRQSFLKNGSAFGYIGLIHPGTKTQETMNAGVDVTTINITDRVCGTSNVAGIQYCVATGTDSPEKSVALMNMIYNNTELQNLLRYGIEGTDYVLTNDGKATYPDGVDNTTVGWANEAWLTGNASLTYPWTTDDVDVWAKYKDFNDNATFSPAYGFTYDSSKVKNEVTAVQNVLDKYTAMIYSGMSDPKESVAKFNSELESAGMQKIVDDVQSQLDAWKAAQ